MRGVGCTWFRHWRVFFLLQRVVIGTGVVLISCPIHRRRPNRLKLFLAFLPPKRRSWPYLPAPSRWMPVWNTRIHSAPSQPMPMTTPLWVKTWRRLLADDYMGFRFVMYIFHPWNKSKTDRFFPPHCRMGQSTSSFPVHSHSMAIKSVRLVVKITIRQYDVVKENGEFCWNGWKTTKKKVRCMNG